MTDTATINRTLLVEAAGGSYVLRAYRHAERAPVEREHAAIAHVCMRGLPAVAPIALPGGTTILERDGRCYALFPRAPGRQLTRGQLTLGDFAAMGAFLARAHAALQSFPLGQAPGATSRSIARRRWRRLSIWKRLSERGRPWTRLTRPCWRSWPGGATGSRERHSSRCRIWVRWSSS